MLGTFFLKLIKPHNWLALLYFLANGFLLFWFFSVVEFVPEINWWQNGLIGAGVYVVSIVCAMSPIGEWIGRKAQGNIKLASSVENSERLLMLFDEVYEKALEKTPSIGKNVKLYICFDDAVNAFALGKNTICVHNGLFDMCDEEIKGILAHEFGHLANRDTLFSLALVAGNMLVSGIFLFCRLVIFFFAFLVNIVLRGRALFLYIVINAIFSFIMFLWTMVGSIFISVGSRADEYKADLYADELGFGKGLADALRLLGSMESKNKMGIFEAINSTHPKTSKRIEKLQPTIIEA